MQVFRYYLFSEIQKREIIVIRVKPEGAFINRIIAMDRGTATVFYGFEFCVIFMRNEMIFMLLLQVHCWKH